MSQAEDIAKFKQAFERLADAPDIPLVIGADAAFLLLAQLQLALRHPANRGESAEVVRGFAVELQRYIAQYIPDLIDLIEKGWHPEFDQDPLNGRQRTTYQHLALDVQEEVLANSFALGMACEILAKMSGHSPSAWVQELAQRANDQVDAMPELAVIQQVKELDRHRKI